MGGMEDCIIRISAGAPEHAWTPIQGHRSTLGKAKARKAIALTVMALTAMALTAMALTAMALTAMALTAMALTVMAGDAVPQTAP